MTDYLQAQTQGTTSAQQSAGSAEDQPANVVRYSYPDAVAVLTDVVPQDTPAGALSSASEGFDIPADQAPIVPLHNTETILPRDVADKLKSLASEDDGITHIYTHESTDDDAPSNLDQVSGDGAELSAEPEIAADAPAEDAEKSKSKKAAI